MPCGPILRNNVPDKPFLDHGAGAMCVGRSLSSSGSLAILLTALGVAPAGEITKREYQRAAQHQVIDHHQGVCGFHAICSAACAASISTASMCDTPQARHSKI